ncbi:hypothetical protein FBEOM_5487 [Fusarium beomiforme]|uniref:Uncharacterized protein n=1 Tax=Fusarium beomiforme TaxID=44412 RepID=A0A9P5AKS6_9HYPO|nr:hypothetical protein FBEOM_5487 [Fusarium beomiforme]
MEPPTKKRRHNSSAQKDARDESDDDELASHPQEIRMRRDPDIQLALKRANADHKLQATMAHIIEKYSRDFEGIGDEIDMNTGEIVVNNGHLRSMRDEGDVEGLWMEGDSNIDEDEGILLEDLTDEYSDTEEPVKEVQDSQSDIQNSCGSASAEQAAPQYHKAHSEVVREVPQTGTDMDNGSSHDSNVMLPPKLRPAQEPHNEPHFGLPPFGPGASLGFGPTPGFGPWGMMPGFPMQAWGRDDIPPYFSMPLSMSRPWFSGGRYDFPTNDGQTSIWSRSQTRKAKRAGSMKVSSKQAASRRSGSTPAKEGAEFADGHCKSIPDEQPADSQEIPASDRTINATDDDDDLIFSGISDVTRSPNANVVPSTKETPTTKDKSHRYAERALEETNGNAVKLCPPKVEDDSARRRSGRARKQTEYMGKISWDDAREWRKSGQTLRVELYKANPALRNDFQNVNPTDGEDVLSSEEPQSSGPPTKKPETERASHRQVVPDSQDTATPFNSSAPETSESKESDGRLNVSVMSIVPGMELSDDEAPLALTRIRGPKSQVKDPNPLSPLIPTRDRNGSAERVISVASSPPKVNRKAKPESEGVQDQSIEPLKRQRGRPKGTKSHAKNANHIYRTTVATNGIITPQRRKVGRPRKSDIANSSIKAGAKDYSSYATRSHGYPHRNEEMQQESAGDDIKTGERPIPYHLTSELKWLLKTKSKSPTSHRSQVRPTIEKSKPEQPQERLQEPSNATDESTEVNEDTPDGQEEDSVPRKSKKSSRESCIVTESSLGIPESVVIVEDDQPPTANALPVIHDNGPAKYSDPPDDRKIHLDETISECMPPHDEAVHDQEFLPELPQGPAAQAISTPRKPKGTRAPLAEPLPSSHKPHTPSHTAIRPTRAPSSRRSLLSFVSDSESDTDGSRDELARRVKSASKTAIVRPSTKKISRTSALTREVYQTPSRKRFQEMSSPISTVKTPGGTLRTCGVDGYQCGRDYCFTCI